MVEGGGDGKISACEKGQVAQRTRRGDYSRVEHCRVKNREVEEFQFLPPAARLFNLGGLSQRFLFFSDGTRAGVRKDRGEKEYLSSKVGDDIEEA